MPKLLTVLLLCGLASCTFFESKEKKTRELVQKELREIDWNDVDAYPIFEFCDETKSKLEQRKCFEKGLLEHFSKTLNEFEYIFTKSFHDGGF